MCRFRGRIHSDTRVILKLHIILLVLSLNSIHYASFGNSVHGFGEKNFFASVKLKLNDPCEVLAKVWKTQNSTGLLPWIHFVLMLNYAETSKFTVLKLISKEQRHTNRKNASYEGAKKLQNKFLVPRIQGTLIHKNLFSPKGHPHTQNFNFHYKTFQQTHDKIT